MLSAMVLGKHQNQIVTIWSNAQAFGRLVDGTENITDYLAGKLDLRTLNRCFRVVISRCPWCCMREAGKAIFCFIAS
jgi:hypothetical protein